jgi:hypothetical protein
LFPKGKNRYHNALLILDTYSQYVWGFKLKVYGTARTTVTGLDTVIHTFRAPEMFMTDGGSHFDNGDVWAWCAAHGAKHHIVAAYSPWINGLVENANMKLLGRLKRLCSPGLGEDEYENTRAEDLTWTWPDHFDTAIRQLNKRIIPAFKFSPKELLLGLVVNTVPTAVSDADTVLNMSDINVHMAYVEQQRLDSADHAAAHAVRRKKIFDKKVLQSHVGEVIFEPGQLVQVYANAMDMTVASSRKLTPRWSAPRRVVSKAGNSYTLMTLEGFPIGGLFHARRLRRFIPHNGTTLATLQAALQGERLDEESEPNMQRELEDTWEEDINDEEDIADD